ncbi:IPT/TIG domain-containing protein [Flavobacterium hibisci]|uniref:IPT/TIG domain-containing protein n=1 Tax=Flavobacterium hibisci TaxID=1914462 RepID=UPI001CC0EE78|nr:IPT/TIG domain-containing protein [Flavobacterium hibisci]MBZ4042998.1 IPT/TIG domain-containing protein [Flavobacterium hibisci]
MKNNKISSLLGFLMLASIVVSLLSACNNDDGASSTQLEVVSVSKAMSSSTPVKAEDNDSITAIGYPGMTYIIKGSGFRNLKHIYFNDKESYFNPTMVTDNTIFVAINSSTPYENGSSELKLVTDAGTIVYPFVIGPPAPVIHSFNPVNAAEGDIITIRGNFFLSPSVTFGTTVVAPVSSTLEEIKVKVPAGADKKYIKVTNITGFATTQYAINTAVFDDVSYNSFDFPDWNNYTYEKDGTAPQGLVYIRKKMGAWDNLQGNWSWNDQLSDYAGIRVTIKGSVPGTVKFIFNGDWSERNMLSITTDWKTFYIPWSELGNPTAVQNFSFQNMTKDSNGDGLANTIDIDNIGYYLK